MRRSGGEPLKAEAQEVFRGSNNPTQQVFGCLGKVTPKVAVGRKSEVNDDPSFQDPHLSIFLDLLVRWLENSTNIFPKWVVRNGVLDLMAHGRNRKKCRLPFVCFCGLNFSLNKSIPLNFRFRSILI